MLCLVENVRRKQLAWVNAILAETKWKPARLARQAGIDHSTLGKFLNDKLNVSQLNSMTVEKIAAAVDLPPYQTTRTAKPRGLAESEAQPFDDESAVTALRLALEALKGGKNSVGAWTLNSRALENVGYIPGDILIVDKNASPAMGDTVCAQVYDRAGRAETIIRLYEDPFLVAASLDRTLMRPMLIDNERVVVTGVVVASLRPFRAA